MLSNPPHPPSLQRQLTFGVIAAVVLVVMAVTALALWTLREDLSRSAGDVQATLADGLARELDADIAERRHALALGATVLGPLGVHDGAALRQHFAQRPLIQTLFDAILVVDRDGRIVFHTPGFTGAPGAPVTDRHYFQDVMRKGQPVISHPGAGKVGGEPGLVFATPIRNAAGDTVGVLCGLFYLDRHNFLTALSSVTVGRGGYVGVATRGERPVMLMQPRRDHLLDPVPPAELNPRLSRALSGIEETATGQDGDGLEALFTHRLLKNAPWVLITAAPAAEAFAGVHRAERAMLALGGLMLVLTAAGLGWFVHHLLKPLDRLRSGLQAAQQRGDGVLDEPAGDPSDVHDVVAACNALMAQIRTARADARQSRERLRVIADNLPLMIAYVDEDERLQFVNETCCSWFDLDPASAMGQDVADALVPLAHAPWTARLKQALAGQQVAFDVRAGLGEAERHLHTVLLPDLRADGSVVGVYVLGWDVTARRVPAVRRPAEAEALC